MYFYENKKDAVSKKRCLLPKIYMYYVMHIQGVSGMGALILTGSGARQEQQFFYLPFCRKTMFNSKKKLEIFH
jgi:hypothetical protein